MKILRARYVVTPHREPIENGAIRIADERIIEVGRAAGIGRAVPGETTDFGDAVILPAFVNGHTHLELSFLQNRVVPSAGFLPWLRAVAGTLASNPPEKEAVEKTAIESARKSLSCGVTLVGDITRYPDWTRPMLRESSLRAVSFGEIIAIGSKRGLLRERLRMALGKQRRPHDENAAFADGTDTPSTRCDQSDAARATDSAAQAEHPRIGISPHSPYSVEFDGLRDCARYAEQHRLPLCIHLAESQEEVEFVRTGRGPLAEFLRDMGVWDGEPATLGDSPVALAAQAGLLSPRTVVAHANYVSDVDLGLLAKSGAAVAYCPRTHAAFGHPPHRFCDMLKTSINVCVGTDSLASNPSLSILDELRFLRCLYPNLDALQLLEMGTIRGARALGMDGVSGSIDPGKLADLAIVPLARTSSGWEDVFDSQDAPTSVLVAGREYL